MPRFKSEEVDALSYYKNGVPFSGGGGSPVLDDVFYVGPSGDDSSGDGSAGSPFRTLQHCYDTWFHLGHPTSWEEFDRKRVIVCLPGTTAATAGDLVAECSNLVVTGHGEIGNVTYDVKSEVMATFTGASGNYESNTLVFAGGEFGTGFGYDSSSADAILKVGNIDVSNFNNVTREVKVALRSCQASVRTQRRADPGGAWTCPIYVDAIDCQIIYCQSGVGAGARAGTAPMVWTRAKDCNFRIKVTATGGAVGFADLSDCYFRRGFEGDPGIAGMVATGTFRGWRSSYFKSAFDVSTAPAQTLQMDVSTLKYLLANASPSWGLCSVALDDVLAGATGSRPSNPATGMVYFDTTIGRPVWWSGVVWVDGSGAPA